MGTFEFTGGSDLDADEFNDNLGVNWTDYTPSWSTSGTQPSIGNGTITGRWARVGNLAYVRISLKWGSTTSGGTNAWNFGLPSGLDGTYDSTFNPWPVWTGTVMMRDVSTSSYHVGFVGLNASGGTTLGLTTSGAFINATSPMTWASTDVLSLCVAYEIDA